MKLKVLITISILLIAIIGCKTKMYSKTYETTDILLTSENGDKLKKHKNISFKKGNAEGTVISIYPDSIKQEIDGIGTSFTESSAYVLAHLDVQKRKEVMEKIFGSSGANFSLTRTHIGACDFSVDGKYSYADKSGDTELSSFNISEDSNGFNPKIHKSIKDSSYDLLPMIKEAQEIKKNQKDSELRIIASAWTAPYWMKDIETWYIPGSPKNNWQGTGGSLKPEYVNTYSNYLIKYIDAYKKEGVDIWGLTPVNEPHGNNGQWESMHFTPKSQSEFVQKHLGPALSKSGNSNVKLLVYDQNRDGLEHWADVIFPADKLSKYIYGVAVHWYESTFKVYEDIFDKVHKKFPEYSIIHTEGCIDDLGKDAPNGVTDPIKFKESNWFDNDDFWWNENATDWAYSVTWEGVKVKDHPAYTPVHRYARNIIVSLDHWVTGWIDWNIILDEKGGPNHVGNFCGAPIMINKETQKVYYTPIYHILSQLSRTIRPGDKAVQTKKEISNLGKDDLHTCATVNENNLLSIQLLNTTKKAINYKLQIKDQYAEIEIAANSLQTVRIKL